MDSSQNGVASYHLRGALLVAAAGVLVNLVLLGRFLLSSGERRL